MLYDRKTVWLVLYDCGYITFAKNNHPKKQALGELVSSTYDAIADAIHIEPHYHTALSIYTVHQGTSDWLISTSKSRIQPIRGLRQKPRTRGSQCMMGQD